MITTDVKYKQTGIDWMPQIPEHWPIVRLKNVAKVIGGATPKSSVSANWDGNINWVTPAEFGDEMYINESVRKITKTGLESCAASLVPPGTIIISNRAPIGSLGIASVEMATNQGCKAVLPFGLDNYYLYFVLSLQKENFNVIGNGTTFRELSAYSLRSYKIPLPPIEEQKAISSFLLTEYNKISRLIQSKQRFIELLKEQRQSIITHAVTKGIDDGVKMKHSGIDWLGDIPSHWEQYRLRKILREGKEGIKIGPFGSSLKLEDLINNGIRVYGQENVINDDFSIGKRFLSKAKFEELSVYEVFPNDILITMMGTTGKCKVVPAEIEKGIMDSHLIRIRIKENLFVPELLALIINESYFIKFQLEISSKGSIMSGLNSLIVKNLMILIPPVYEQQRIVEHIKAETHTLDIAIRKAEREIELIKEYREALIAEAVTGKIKMNN